MFGTWGGSVYVDPCGITAGHVPTGVHGAVVLVRRLGWFSASTAGTILVRPVVGPGWGPASPGWHGGHHWAYRPHNYRLDGGGRPSRYVPSVASEAGTANRHPGYRNGTTTSRGATRAAAGHQMADANNRNSSVYNGGSNRNNNNNS